MRCDIENSVPSFSYFGIAVIKLKKKAIKNNFLGQGLDVATATKHSCNYYVPLTAGFGIL